MGDFVVQNEAQELHEAGGLGREPLARRALLAHIVVYMLAFVPALIWRGSRIGVAEALGIGALIAVTHLPQDDGRLLGVYMSRVKTVREPSDLRLMGVDLSLHFVVLLGVALLAA
ncbi:MAG: hypothetical protein ICV69_10625 [Thermoleophilaceae bacterium]|nr:hypothetical protein [Thermoleophilaceae bacterium]